MAIEEEERVLSCRPPKRCKGLGGGEGAKGGHTIRREKRVCTSINEYVTYASDMTCPLSQLDRQIKSRGGRACHHQAANALE
jgi:hypothetical protein